MKQARKSNVLAYVKKVLGKGADELRNTLEEFADFKKRLQRFIIGTGMIVLGIVIFVVGLLEVIAYFFPGWEKGLIYMILGVIIIFGAFMYRKYG